MRARQASLGLDEWDRAAPLPPEALESAASKSELLHQLFAEQCRQFRLPPVERELRFAKAAMGKQWRFDFAWRDYKLAVEIQGVVVRKIAGKVYTMGGHADVQGMRNDHAKHNAAIVLGWSVLQFMQDDIKPKRAIETTMVVLAARGWTPHA